MRSRKNVWRTQVLSLVLGCMGCLVISGCKEPKAPSVEIPKVQVPEVGTPDLSQIKYDTDAMGEATKLLLAPGGQPGVIMLSGGLVGYYGDKPNELAWHPSLSIHSKTGTGYKNRRPRVVSSSVILEAKITDDAKKDRLELDDDNTFISVGCGETTRAELTGLSEGTAQLDAKKEDLQLRARVVWICGDINSAKELQNVKTISIVADTVIVSEMRLQREGILDNIFSLNTRQMVLEGKSYLSTKGKDDSTTHVFGPTVILSAEQLSGTGHLSLQAIGASYLEKDPETAAETAVP